MKFSKVIFIFLAAFCVLKAQTISFDSYKIDLKSLEKERVLAAAEKYVTQSPVTVTSSFSNRSAGGTHDYFSESDYWWPNPENPEGPYIRKDGMTNPANFDDHRQAMRRLSIQVPALTSAYLLTKDKKYSDKAIEHILAWFVNEETRMNPSMQYAQAVKGVSTGRGVGIIDAIHLIEVVRSMMIYEKENLFDQKDLAELKSWFSEFIVWLTTSKNGLEELAQANNHGACYIMQLAIYSKFVGNNEQIEFCIKRYKEVLLPNQMAENGSFPLELARTKPYNYSLFNLDALANICQILSDEKENLFEYTLIDGRNLKKGMEFLYPYIKDKSTWPYHKDVMFYDDYPNRQSSLLFAAVAFKEAKYLELWKSLDPDPVSEEVIRNLPIRQPLIWYN